MVSMLSATSPSQRVPAWVSMLTSVLTGLLKRSSLRWLNGLMPSSARLIQLMTSLGSIQLLQPSPATLPLPGKVR